MGVLPASTDATVSLALKGINVCATLKDVLKENIGLLEDHGGHGAGGPSIFLAGSSICRTSRRPTAVRRSRR